MRTIDTNAPTSRTAPPDVGTGGSADRLAWVFRHSLRDRTIHPALPLVQRLREVSGVLGQPVAQAPALPLTQRPSTIPDAALLRHLNRLPANPRILCELSAMMGREQVRVGELAQLIENDQSLTAAMLRIANSPFYGRSGRIASVEDAISLLGVDSLSMLLTSAAMPARASLEPGHLRGFWVHSVATATLSRALAERVGLPPDQAFLGGLMHDLGQLALVHLFPDQAADALALSRAGDLTLVAAERCLLDRDHAAIGCWIARQWRFPVDVALAIGNHHEPAADADDCTLPDLVHVADSLVHAMDLSGDDDECLPDFDRAAWERLDLSENEYLDVLRQAERQVRRLTEVMN